MHVIGGAHRALRICDRQRQIFQPDVVADGAALLAEELAVFVIRKGGR